MNKTAFLFIHGVAPDLSKKARPGYSKPMFDALVAELQKRGADTAGCKRFEVNWSPVTFRFKNRLAALQFDAPPPRKNWLPGKKQIQEALRNFIYPAVIDILFYVKNKGSETNREKMPEMDLLHRETRKLYKQGFRKMVLLAHSLGSVAAYDYVFRFEELFPFPEDLELTCFVTFGSPIALFAAGMGYPVSTKIKKPAYARKWINLWEFDDPIATRLLPHFPKKFSNNFLTDIEVDTTLLNPMNAHSSYWTHPKVIERIARELAP